jgi:molybdenum cofactor cytidylyltransferase
MNTPTAPAPRIVVLAAGYSRRLGRPKALARVRGISLLARTVDVLTPWAAGAIIVVVPPRAASYRVGLESRGVEFVVNDQRALGLSSSVLRGVQRARHSAAVMLVPVDLVALNRRDAARLIARWRAGRRRVVARRVDDFAGAPLILPHRFIALIRGVRGDRGLRDWVRGLSPDSVQLVDMPSAGSDVDTPGDLACARRRARPVS